VPDIDRVAGNPSNEVGDGPGSHINKHFTRKLVVVGASSSLDSGSFQHCVSSALEVIPKDSVHIVSIDAKMLRQRKWIDELTQLVADSRTMFLFAGQILVIIYLFMSYFYE